MTATVRPATPDDADVIFDLAVMLAIGFSVEREPFDTSFLATLGTPGTDVLVAETDGRVVGYLLGFHHPSYFANGPVAWVEELAIAADVRRQGIGASLLHSYEERVRTRGCKLVALATTRAGHFYRAVGYEDRASYYCKVL